MLRRGFSRGSLPSLLYSLADRRSGSPSSPSGQSIVIGGFAIVAFGWVWLSRLADRRARGGAALEIVATSQGLTSPLWSIDWDRVAGMWIGPSAVGAWSGGKAAHKLQALHIEPMRPEDLHMVDSKTLRLNARVGDAMRLSSTQILQVNVDRPLAELESQLRSISGRSLASR